MWKSKEVKEGGWQVNPDIKASENDFFLSLFCLNCSEVGGYKGKYIVVFEQS